MKDQVEKRIAVLRSRLVRACEALRDAAEHTMEQASDSETGPIDGRLRGLAAHAQSLIDQIDALEAVVFLAGNDAAAGR